MDNLDKIVYEKQSTDFVKNEEWVTTTKYDDKGNIVEIECVDKFWGIISSDNEKQLRKLGETLSQKIKNSSSSKEISNYWKRIIQKMAPSFDSKHRVYCRYILLGAGYSVSEIKQLERIIDGN